MKRTNGKFITFFRRNTVYIVLAFCILAVGLSMALVISNNGKDNLLQEKPIIKEEIDDGAHVNGGVEDEGAVDDTPVENPDDGVGEPVVSVISFIMPVDTNSYTEYSETMVFNSTLGRFSSHTAMDFYAEEGSSVYAVLDGKVESEEERLGTKR